MGSLCGIFCFLFSQSIKSTGSADLIWFLWPSLLFTLLFFNSCSSITFLLFFELFAISFAHFLIAFMTCVLCLWYSGLCDFDSVSLLSNPIASANLIISRIVECCASLAILSEIGAERCEEHVRRNGTTISNKTAETLCSCYSNIHAFFVR